MLSVRPSLIAVCAVLTCTEGHQHYNNCFKKKGIIWLRGRGVGGGGVATEVDRKNNGYNFRSLAMILQRKILKTRRVEVVGLYVIQLIDITLLVKLYALSVIMHKLYD